MRAQAWPTTTLGRVVDFFAGGSLPEGQPYEGQDGGYFLMKVSDMNLPGNETAILRSKEWNKSPGARSATCPAGAVVIPKRGGAIGTNKKRLITRPAVLDPNLMAVWPHPDKVDLKFLYQWFLTFDLASIASGSSVPQLNKRDLAPLPFPLPPIQEQRRIAEVLDRADGLRAKRREALAHLDDLTQSIFIDMFGDLSTNSKGWQLDALVSLCETDDDIKCGPFGTQLSKDEYKTTGVPLWGIKNVNSGFSLPAWEFLDADTATRLSQYSLLPGDIVMTRKGTIGNCAVYPEDYAPGVMHSDLLRLRLSPEKAVSVFLAHQLHYSSAVAAQIARISAGAVMPGINVTKLKQLKVMVPPLELQEEFASRMRAVERIRDSHRASLAELDALVASLQDRAFRGLL